VRALDRRLLFALIAANLLLRLSWLGVNELAHDEPFTVYWALRPLGEFFAMLGTENNPPLHFLLVRAWTALVPLDEAWLRLPSALFSALTVWPLFLLARRHAGTLAAVAAGLLYTFSAYQQGFAHEVRAYSLFTLLAVAGMWRLSRLASGNSHALLWLVVLNAAMVYTHFFGWLMIGVQGLCVLLVKEWRGAWRAWAKALALVVLAALPYMGLFARRAGESVSGGTWLTVPPLEEVYNMVWRWSNAPVIAVALLALIAWTAIARRGKGTALGIGLIWTFVPLLGMWVVSQWVPMYLDRYLVFAAPGFCLLAGHAVAGLPRRAGVVATVLLGLGLAFTMRPWKDNGMRPSAVVAKVEEWRSEDPGAAVLVAPSWYRLTYRWAEDRSTFGHETPDSLHAFTLHAAPDASPRTVLLVDADAGHQAAGAAWLDRLARGYPRQDSVEVYRTVSVRRFQR